MTEIGKYQREEDLILYIASKLKDSKGFGSIMLNKVLYYSDNIHYVQYGRAISGFKYVNRPLGPTPNADLFLPIRQKLIREGRAKEEIYEGININRKKLVVLKPVTLHFLSNEETKIIDDVIEQLRHLTAYEVSDISHNELGWKLTNDGEEIPFGAFSLSIPELTDEDYIWFDDTVKKLKLSVSY